MRAPCSNVSSRGGCSGFEGSSPNRAGGRLRPGTSQAGSLRKGLGLFFGLGFQAGSLSGRSGSGAPALQGEDRVAGWLGAQARIAGRASGQVHSGSTLHPCPARQLAKSVPAGDEGGVTGRRTGKPRAEEGEERGLQRPEPSARCPAARLHPGGSGLGLEAPAGRERGGTVLEHSGRPGVYKKENQPSGVPRVGGGGRDGGAGHRGESPGSP